MAYESLIFDMCCAARMLYRAGLSVANAGHLSVSLGHERMLVNRFGPSFATVTSADILTVGYDGQVLSHDPRVSPYVNETILLHGVIHRYNSRAAVVVHTHPPATVTFSAFRRVPEIYDQESCLLAGEIGVVDEDYSGLASSEERVRAAALELGKYRAVILPNHGAITSADNLQTAVVTMMLLEAAVQRHLAVAAAARATGLAPTPIAPEHALTAKRELGQIPFLQPLWEDMMKRLQRTDPDLFAHHAATA